MIIRNKVLILLLIIINSKSLKINQLSDDEQNIYQINNISDITENRAEAFIKWKNSFVNILSDKKLIRESNIVYTPFGKIQGESTSFKTRLGKPIYSFRGIRYAESPVKNLRFKPPIMTKPWNNSTLDATFEGPACPQPSLSNFETSEDCLRLNIYTTKIPNESSNSPYQPVIVYFHSGGFYRTSAQSLFVGPQYLLDMDVVLVTVNYRLGILGFINTGDEYAPGNNGLKDQVVALKFIRTNIEAFSGDSSKITILGYGSGAISVALHLISSMSEGLFHRAIVMSGSPTGTFNFQTHQTHSTRQHVEILRCPTDISKKMLNCLRNKSVDEISMSINRQHITDLNPLLIWQPVIEPNHNGERFLVDNPTKLFKNGEYMKVPVMIGITENEFDYLAYIIMQNNNLLRQLDKNFTNMVTKSLIFGKNVDKSQNISRTIREFYFGNASINIKLVDQLGKAYSDALVGFPVNRLVKLIANTNHNSLYYYKFSYHGIYSNFYLPIISNPVGPVHHDDLMYLFYNSQKFPLFGINDPALRTMERMHKLWADFAKFGNPTPSRNYLTDGVIWEPFTLKNNKYIEIKCTLKMKKDLHVDRYALWEQLFPLFK